MKAGRAVVAVLDDGEQIRKALSRLLTIQCSIYMEQAPALFIMRMLLLRIKSWEHYLFFVKD
ncbi:hypothetical protein [Verrucomicrobium spinosum]|uniref:hypothetical protein n=1 Tax=Verrucomicrobium spinosum TaxID=2736 RepID=UPI0001744664|nr:hypothetical protein [Verrucomicrobium spinosum]